MKIKKGKYVQTHTRTKQNKKHEIKKAAWFILNVRNKGNVGKHSTIEQCAYKTLEFLLVFRCVCIQKVWNVQMRKCLPSFTSVTVKQEKDRARDTIGTKYTINASHTCIEFAYADFEQVTASVYFNAHKKGIITFSLIIYSAILKQCCAEQCWHP